MDWQAGLSFARFSVVHPHTHFYFRALMRGMELVRCAMTLMGKKFAFFIFFLCLVSSAVSCHPRCSVLFCGTSSSGRVFFRGRCLEDYILCQICWHAHDLTIAVASRALGSQWSSYLTPPVLLTTLCALCFKALQCVGWGMCIRVFVRLLWDAPFEVVYVKGTGRNPGVLRILWGFCPAPLWTCVLLPLPVWWLVECVSGPVREV